MEDLKKEGEIERRRKLGFVWEIDRKFERKREQKMTINPILGLRGKSIAPKFPPL